MAALPASKARVHVGPPLSASDPSNGFVLIRSSAAAKPQVLALSRLLPCETIVPVQLLGLPAATMDSLTRNVLPLLLLKLPPVPELAVLPEKVSAMMVVTPGVFSPSVLA